MINLKLQEKRFSRHIATFQDLGCIKILDFKRPDSCEYRIRFMFEEDYYRLHISGDLGELIASNYKNMCWEGFKDYVHNPGYFEGKIICHSRRIYSYDYDLAKEKLEEILKDYDFTPEYDFETEEELRGEKIEEILEDFDEDTGIGRSGYQILHEYDSDCWEYISNIGKEETGILDLYMLAFELAVKQLKEAMNVEKNNSEEDPADSI